MCLIALYPASFYRRLLLSATFNLAYKTRVQVTVTGQQSLLHELHVHVSFQISYDLQTSRRRMEGLHWHFQQRPQTISISEEAWHICDVMRDHWNWTVFYCNKMIEHNGKICVRSSQVYIPKRRTLIQVLPPLKFSCYIYNYLLMHICITKEFGIMNTCISRFGIRIGDRKYLNEYTPFGSVSLWNHNI